LAGNRMNQMRRLADKFQPARDGALRQHQPQGIAPARPDRLDGSEKVADARGKLRPELPIGERDQPRGEFCPIGTREKARRKRSRSPNPVS
jgi:hypothetical protein